MARKDGKRLARQEAKEAKRAWKAEGWQHRRKARAVLSRSELAGQPRVLASQVEAGTFVLGDKKLDLPAQAEIEIAYKLKKTGGHQIGVEIEWGDRKTAAPLLTESGMPPQQGVGEGVPAGFHDLHRCARHTLAGTAGGVLVAQF